jgi:TBC1 domain family member 20
VLYHSTNLCVTTLVISRPSLLSPLLTSLLGPILLGSTGEIGGSGTTTPEEKSDPHSWKELPRHRDEDQVQLDVNRAFIYYPNSTHAPSLRL